MRQAIAVWFSFMFGLVGAASADFMVLPFWLGLVFILAFGGMAGVIAYHCTQTLVKYELR